MYTSGIGELGALRSENDVEDLSDPKAGLFPHLEQRFHDNTRLT